MYVIISILNIYEVYIIMTEKKKLFTPKTLLEKIYDIQCEIGSVEKTDTNGGVPYKVLAYNDVNKAVREMLKKHRVCAIPTTTSHEKTGNFTEVVVGITLYNVDNPSDSMEFNGFVGYGVDNSDKGIGKAYSYAYKYLFLKLFNMNIGKDEESEDKQEISITDESLVKIKQSKNKSSEIKNQLESGGIKDGVTDEKQLGAALQSS